MKKNYITPQLECISVRPVTLMGISTLPGGGSKTDGNPPGAPGRRVF